MSRTSHRAPAPRASVIVSLVLSFTMLKSLYLRSASCSAALAFIGQPSLTTRHNTASFTYSMVFGAPSSTSTPTNNAMGEDRELELKRLANTLNVSPGEVLVLLAKQRGKMNGTEEKAKHIDWLLSADTSMKASSRKRKEGKTYDKKKMQTVSQTKQNRSTAATGNTGATAKTKQKRPRPRRPAVVTQKVEERRSEAERRQEEALKDPSLLTDVEFATRKDLHPSSKRALAEVMGLTSMTEIQSKTFAAALSGRDVLGRARTGTGKTVAFLLPAIERVLRSREYRQGLNIGVLVISPTRELAMQIGDEAEKLLTYHTDMTVQVVFGGTKVARDVSRLNKGLPTILVATPGRLQDLLETVKVGGRKFSDIMGTTPVVVLDETDQLLDMGFRREIKKILTYLPRNNKRQTLLFSATIPDELKQIMADTMKDDYIEVDCISDGAATAMHTNVRVKQSHALIHSMDQYMSSVVRVVREAIQDGDGNNKIVVFFPTARMVSFFADVFNETNEAAVLELHSKKTQGYRNRVSGQFRSASTGLLFTSDVSARGVDYPGVSHVIQFGMPSSREQYIHRLGRTGRAGSEGKGWLILAPFESLFLEELKNIDVPRDPDLAQILSQAASDDTNDIIQEMKERIGGGDKTLSVSGQGAYQAFLGYYLGQMKRLKIKDKKALVNIANEFSSAMGFRQVPALGKNMVGKMGLKGVSGIFVKAPGEGDGQNHQITPKRGHLDGRRGTRPKRKVRR
mmetsp:Transcript_35568/g.77894  ORF Transcript_35568/g.77894 Transcript_35568/m.77894 type:complete len:740 (+) Transcript_35568:260-2479(+)